MKTIAFVLLAATAACSKSEQPPAPSGHVAGPVKKDPAAARQLIAKGALVLDVRSPDEYQDGHVASATNIPIDGFADQLAQVAQLTGGDKSKPIVVYCAAGGRAARAKKMLDEAGYTQVVNGGGYDDLR